MGRLFPRGCTIFNCDRRHGNVCCADCGFKSSGACKNPCLNGPDRCGQVLPRAKTNQTKNGRK